VASLRKRTPDVSPVEPPPAVEAEFDASPPPSPGPLSEPVAPPQDDAAAALQRQINEIKRTEALQREQNDAQVAMLAAQERRQAWLEATPAAKENVAALNVLHQAALNAGLADTSQEYFSFLENQLATLQRPAAAAANLVNEMQQRAAQVRPQEQPPRPTRLSAAHVSAPVSREIPTGAGMPCSGRITLTLEQREAARMSGISEADYAKQLLKLRELQASGEYSDRR
jgi:hypothetical protein